jgi:hypothetical protein
MDYRNQWIDPPRLPRAMARRASAARSTSTSTMARARAREDGVKPSLSGHRLRVGLTGVAPSEACSSMRCIG